MPAARPIEERFWEKVVRHGDDECWGWRAYLDERGYGRVWLGNSMKYAHRISWRLNRGAIPPGLDVLHKCDNPACTNPNHLFLGTHQDNMTDKAQKGRAPRGTQTPRAKLTVPLVLEARARYGRGGTSMYALAKEYGITPQAMEAVLKRRSWAWVP